MFKEVYILWWLAFGGCKWTKPSQILSILIIYLKANIYKENTVERTLKDDLHYLLDTPLRYKETLRSGLF